MGDGGLTFSPCYYQNISCSGKTTDSNAVQSISQLGRVMLNNHSWTTAWCCLMVWSGGEFKGVTNLMKSQQLIRWNFETHRAEIMVVPASFNSLRMRIHRHWLYCSSICQPQPDCQPCLANPDKTRHILVLCGTRPKESKCWSTGCLDLLTLVFIPLPPPKFSFPTPCLGLMSPTQN